jgi:hypothetical protein
VGHFERALKPEYNLEMRDAESEEALKEGPMRPDYNNPTSNDIHRFRDTLFKQLTFEPVRDQDFDRPVEKLRSLVNQSTELIDRLRAVVSRYNQLIPVFIAAQKGIENGREYMEKVRTFGAELPSFEQTFLAIVTSASSTTEEREAVRLKKALLRKMRNEAMQLSLTFIAVDGNAVLLPFQLNTSQLLAIQLWAFLEEMTAAVARGTKQVFEKNILPADPKELLSDAVDYAVEEAGLPNVTPVLHIVEFIYKYIRRKERREQRLSEKLETSDMNDILSSYFHWWTENDGGSVATDSVLMCESTLAKHDGIALKFGQQAGDFGKSLAEFQQHVEQQMQK